MNAPVGSILQITAFGQQGSLYNSLVLGGPAPGKQWPEANFRAAINGVANLGLFSLVVLTVQRVWEQFTQLITITIITTCSYILFLDPS